MAGFFEFSLMRVRDDIDQKVLSELFHEYMNVEEDFIRGLIEGVRLPSTPLLLASNNGSAIRTFSARVLNAALDESLAADYDSA